MITVIITFSVRGILPVLVEPCQQLGHVLRRATDYARFWRSAGTEPYVVLQGDGDHFAPSGSFLKCELVTNGCVRYCGSSTTVVTVNH